MKSTIEIRHVGVAVLATGLLLGAAGCETEGGQAEMSEIPEVAEIEPQVGEDGVELEEALPLTSEDVGDIIMASGTVVGQPLPHGYFLETEHDLVIFVESSVEVEPGQVISVAGPLGEVAAPVFEEWEVDAFDGEIEAEYEWVRLFFIDDDAIPVS
ncbi:MAG: hypothetical protein R3304_09560 [Longimicrobiales bacterium]|nr:hypothetical protein [Longimicrobiales bacterium]